MLKSGTSWGSADPLESLEGKSHCRVQDNSAGHFHLAESIGHVEASGVWPALCHYHTELHSLHNTEHNVKCGGKPVQNWLCHLRMLLLCMLLVCKVELAKLCWPPYLLHPEPPPPPSQHTATRVCYDTSYL